MNGRHFLASLCGAFVVASSSLAFGSAPAHFGHGARSEALSRADVADADATSAPVQNAALAAEPGLRVRLGYAYGFMDLRIDDRRASVADVSGVDFAAQLGLRLPASFSAGFALAAHLPDGQIAKIGFRPGTEPQFVRYESVLQRATFDLALALRRGPFSIGGGASFSLDMGGAGTSFELGQDARGTYADAASDITLPYRVAPLVGLAVDLGRASLGASYRGALAVGLSVESDIRIALAENPLNGTTHVSVRGSSGWDPARLSFGGRLRVVSGLSAYGAVEWQGYRAAPPPVADVSLDVALGTSPGRKEVTFVLPRFRDVLAPRLGLEWVCHAGKPGGPREEGDRKIRWAARVGYSFLPSPVPPQTGFTSYADASSHTIGAGFGLGLGRHWGVDLRVDLSAQASILEPRKEQKSSAALPNASYTVSGRSFRGALSFEGAFR